MSAVLIRHRTTWRLVQRMSPTFIRGSTIRWNSSTSSTKNEDPINSDEDASTRSPLLERPLIRSFFYVPGSNKRFLEKSITSDADMVVLDLEDGVAASEKGTARKQIAEHLLELSERKKAELSAAENTNDEQEEGITKQKEPIIALRINDGASEHVGFDVKEVLLSPGASMISTIVVPKVKYTLDVVNIMGVIRGAARSLGPQQLSWARNLGVIPLIESPAGVMNLQNLLKFSLGKECNIPAAVFAAEDFRADARLPYVEGNWNIDWSRSYFVMSCKRMGVEPLDMVCLDFREEDQKILKAECQKGYEMGFVGKQVIHPSQVPVVNDMFAPTQEQIDFAEKVMKAKKEADEKGVGAIAVDGKMIDEPMWKYSRILLDKAVKAGLYSSSKVNEIAAEKPMARREPKAWNINLLKKRMKEAGIKLTSGPKLNDPGFSKKGKSKPENKLKENAGEEDD